MDLHSGLPFFLLKDGFVSHYGTLASDRKTEVAIIGGGISGALAAWYLVNAGVHVIVLDKRHIVMGSTCASTSLIQYEIDTPLFKLIKKVGVHNAVQSYCLGIDAIHRLKEITTTLGKEIDFEYKQSLYVCSDLEDLADLEMEYETRKKFGFKVMFLSPADIFSKFGFTAPAAILSRDGAQLNSYMLTHKIMESCINKGSEVYDQANIVSIRHSKNKTVLTAGNGFSVTTKYLVYACGYEIEKYLDKSFASLHSTYAVISEPFGERELWYKNCLIWETARPYTYMRTTKDHRVIAGGRDEKFSNPKKRDLLIRKKSRQIVTAFNKKFPHLEFKPDFRWTGTFAETKDGLPYIGKYKHPRSYYILGFGGNGITFSEIAGRIIRDLVLKKRNKDYRIFSFER